MRMALLTTVRDVAGERHERVNFVGSDLRDALLWEVGRLGLLSTRASVREAIVRVFDREERAIRNQTVTLPGGHE